MYKLNTTFKNMLFLFVGFFVMSALSACSTTKNSATWTDYEYTGGPLKKIVVVGVFKNLSSRRAFEDKIARKINQNSGVEAVSSLDFLPPGVKYERANMEKTFTEKGFDGKLIVRTKSVDNRLTYVPGKSFLVQNVHRLNYPSYHNVYAVTWKTVREPAYFDESYIVSTESSLFLNSNDKMIWTMEKTTEENYRAADGITNPKAESAIVADLIFKSLKAEKLLVTAGKVAKSK